MGNNSPGAGVTQKLVSVTRVGQHLVEALLAQSLSTRHSLANGSLLRLVTSKTEGHLPGLSPFTAVYMENILLKT